MEEEKSVYEVEVDCRTHSGEDQTLLVVAPGFVEAHAKAVKLVNDRRSFADSDEACRYETIKVELIGVIDVQ